ncbi:MAG: outer membrane protein assembly factor BamD, partial [Aestuariivirga sp.]
QNFPDSQWDKDAYTIVSTNGQQPVENQSSWISRLFKG